MATAIDRKLAGNHDLALLVGRILLALLVLVAAYNKFGMGYTGTTGYFTKLGIPAPSLMTGVVLAFEAIVGIMLLVGYQTRLAALALAAFCIVTALVAHTNIADGNQLNHLLKNFAVAGGALALFVAGPGSHSVDAKRG